MDEETETLFESEATKTPAEVATLFYRLGDGLRDESRVSFREGEDAIAISVPSELSVEVEVERETTDEGREATEVEVELEWEGAKAEAKSGEEADPGDTDQRSEASAITNLGAPDEQPPTSMGRFEVYRDRADEWRWRLVHRNGNIIATSGEGYTSRQNAEKGLRSVMTNAPGAAVTTEEE